MHGQTVNASLRRSKSVSHDMFLPPEGGLPRLHHVLRIVRGPEWQRTESVSQLTESSIHRLLPTLRAPIRVAALIDYARRGSLRRDRPSSGSRHQPSTRSPLRG